MSALPIYDVTTERKPCVGSGVRLATSLEAVPEEVVGLPFNVSTVLARISMRS